MYWLEWARKKIEMRGQRAFSREKKKQTIQEDSQMSSGKYSLFTWKNSLSYEELRFQFL